MDYRPLDWYWLADDGRIFASARQTIVDAEDEGYIAALDTGAVTRWPVDDAGQQTTSSLQATLTPYGLWIDLAAYARSRSYMIRTSGTSINGMPIKTDADTLSLINGMAALAQLDATEVFSFDTGASVVTLTAEQAIAISTAVGKWVQGTFTKRGSVLADIASGKLKSVSDVDGAFAS